MSKDTPARKPYSSDLTDDQWTILEPLIPAARTQHGGRPRKVDMREVINTLLYLNRSGCQWEMLPHDLLPKSTGNRSRGRVPVISVVCIFTGSHILAIFAKTSIATY